MTIFQFKIPGQGFATNSGTAALPVDIRRKADFALVAAATTDQSVELEPGEYVAVSRLPSGSTYSEEVTVQPNTESIELGEAATAIKAFHKSSFEIKDFFESALPLTLFGFNPFSESCVQDTTERKFEKNAVFSSPEDNQSFRYVRLRQKETDDSDIFIVALPFPARVKSCLELQLLSDGSPWPRFILPRQASTLIYEFMACGNGDAANRMSRSDMLKLLDLVNSKQIDPFAGAVGMYLLLNNGFLDELGDRCKKLWRYNENLADASVIYAEYLFRYGKTKKAIGVLESVVERGLPLMRLGYSMAIQRIEICQMSGVQTRSLDRIKEVYTDWARKLVSRSVTSVYKVDPLSFPNNELEFDGG